MVAAKPRLLAQALGMVVDQGLRPKEDLLASDFTLAAGDIEDLCGLVPGWFETDTGKVVTLTVKARESEIARGAGNGRAFRPKSVMVSSVQSSEPINAPGAVAVDG